MQGPKRWTLKVFNKALALTNRKTAPFNWAQTQWNLGDFCLARHGVAPNPTLLAKARTHALAAREVFVEASDYQTELCDELLARLTRSRC